ncbi:DEKNAAC101116 [Brettanomyces naardenensis]|uniref:Purine nucleoside phosphorylase n=1 Tax=Brettanomyces naardenensis TaxID=13370 RepID=A0A448YH21_BRENA|nr:DEKNAAC101116 [Brettanomyces naardenensis]
MSSGDITSYGRFEIAARAITDTLRSQNASKSLLSPKVLIICGSGLGGIAKILHGETVKIPYANIPGFKESTVSGHEGCLLFGKIGANDVPVVCMVGRLHYYEGYDFADATFPIRVVAVLGVRLLIATNACGGVNETYKPGDLMVINDHINLPGLAGNHPLRGPNFDEMGPRFPAMSDAYDFDLRLKFFNAVKKLGIERSIHEGIYTYCCGPSFETRAECRLIRSFGGDTVGMSTVPEILVARHCSMRCFGLSLVTNNVLSDPPPSAREASARGWTAEQVGNQSAGRTSHAEVLKEGQAASEDVNVIMKAFINELTDNT